jgi:O-antigen biosynthesis protein
MTEAALAIIPTYCTRSGDIEMLDATLRSLRAKTPDGRCDILVVDDGSPTDLRGAVASTVVKWDAVLAQQMENRGFSATVNVGLKLALEAGQDAVLVNADIEIITDGWLDRLQATEGLFVEGPAAVVGALLFYPAGLIQHGGVYFSLLTRDFNHAMKYAPMNLPAALKPSTCPVTGALQFIRHETLTSVGLYDERFKLGMEDIDYCLRTFKAGLECVYQPRVKAWHHESVFRGRRNEKLDRMHAESYYAFMDKWSDENFAGLVPLWQ